MGVARPRSAAALDWAADEAAATSRPLHLVHVAAAQLGVAVGVRARPRTWQNPFLPWAVAVAFTLQVLAVSLSPHQRLLGAEPLTVSQIVQVSAVSALGYLAARLQVVIQNRRSRRA